MDLIERYLQAVRVALPKSQRDDIIKELSDNILSQVEEREGALGRPLNEGEVVELLRKTGKPAKLAAAYGEQQGLIAPAVMPIYWKILKLSLGLAFVAQLIAGILLAAAGKPMMECLAPIFRFPSTALTVFALVTLVFVMLRICGAKVSPDDSWDPRQLPPLAKPVRKRSRTEAIAALIAGAIATIWWLTGLHHPWLIMGPGVAVMAFAPIWLRLFPVFVLAGVADVVRHTLEIMRPYAIRANKAAGLVMRSVGLLILVLLFRANELFVPADPNNAQLQQMMSSLNFALHLGLGIATIISFGKLMVDAWKLWWGRMEQQHQAALGG